MPVKAKKTKKPKVSKTKAKPKKKVTVKKKKKEQLEEELVLKKDKKEILDLENLEIDSNDSVELDLEERDEEHEFKKVELNKNKKSKKKGKKIKKEIEKIEEDEIEEEKEDEGELSEEDKIVDKINKELVEIYEDEDGNLPDMKSFKKKKRSKIITAFTILLSSCILLAVVAWLGFFVFQPKGNFNEKDVILSISGDADVVPGQEVTYRIRYRNAQSIPLSKAVLQVRYPEGFIFENSTKDPTNDKKDEWSLGTLDKYDSGYIDISGKLYGDLEKKQSFRVFLNYIPSNFSSEFQKVDSINTNITESPINLSVQGPEEIIPGVETEFVIKLEKEEDIDVNNIFIAVDGGDIFSKVESQPASNEDNMYQWSLSALEDDKLSIKGTFNPGEAVDKGSIVFKVLGWKDSEHNEDAYTYKTVEKELKFTRTELSLGLVINGSISDLNVQPGEVLSTSLVLKNVGDTRIDKIRTRLIYEAPSYNEKSLLNWSELDDSNDGVIAGEQLNEEVRRGIITWTNQQIKNLTWLDSGEEFMIDVHLPIKGIEDFDLTKFINFQASVTAEVQFELEGEQKTLSSNSINMIVNSDLSFDLQDNITANDDGKEVHTIDWILNNNFHELKDLELEANIYGDITWNEFDLVVPAGEAKFDKDSKKLVWKIDSMPTSIDVLALRFSMILNKENPSQTNLTSKVKIKATDVITGEQIFLSGDEVLLNEEVEE